MSVLNAFSPIHCRTDTQNLLAVSSFVYLNKNNNVRNCRLWPILYPIKTSLFRQVNVWRGRDIENDSKFINVSRYNFHKFTKTAKCKTFERCINILFFVHNTKMLALHIATPGSVLSKNKKPLHHWHPHTVLAILQR